MGSCVSSSIEVAARERGLRYLIKPDIFTHASCPDRTREAANPLAMPLSSFSGAKTIVPDDLFGIEYPGTKPTYRFFAVEIDRNTESIERRRLDQTAYSRKLHAYMEVMKSRAYRDHWGVPNLMVLTVTTNVTHMENMLAYLKKVGEPNLASRFLFKGKPEFGSSWRISPVMRDLLSEPWQSTEGEFSIDK